MRIIHTVATQLYFFGLAHLNDGGTRRSSDQEIAALQEGIDLGMKLIDTSASAKALNQHYRRPASRLSSEPGRRREVKRYHEVLGLEAYAVGHRADYDPGKNVKLAILSCEPMREVIASDLKNARGAAA